MIYERMRSIELGLRSPHNVNGIATDPQPDWSFDKLLVELESINSRNLIADLELPVHFTKTQLKKLESSKKDTTAGGFLMYVSDDDSYSSDDYSEDEEDMSLAHGRRFVCDELNESDDSEIDMPPEMQCWMGKVGLEESALIELTNDYLLRTTEEARSATSSIKAELVDDCEKFRSFINKIDRRRELQHELDMNSDLQYKRTIAEALDGHLTAVQRNHEHVSKLEERRIRDDAAREEARRKEMALVEERMQQERLKAEEEARLKAEMAEKAKAAAIEAEKRAAEDAAAKVSSENTTEITRGASGDSNGGKSMSTGVVVKKDAQSEKKLMSASKNALELEKRRRKIYDELIAEYTVLRGNDNPVYRQMGQIIGRQFKTISVRVENVSLRAEELVKTINRPGCPQSFGIKLFAEKILSICTSRKSSNAVFAISCVIVLVTSKIPVAMDILLAEWNSICIYTVPKHIHYSKEVFRTSDDYLKALGYEEVNGELESTEAYLNRLRSYMRLYGALIQTEVAGFPNPHGLREGWAWLARFLNSLPANLYTAAALRSFLETAGYALYRKYRNQFEKLLKIIAGDFLNSLEAGGSKSASMEEEKTWIRLYIQYQEYREEPKNLQLQQGDLDSYVLQ